MVTFMPAIMPACLAAGLVHMKAKICNNDDITLSFLVDKILVDCSQNCQSAKINSLPKFLAIQYYTHTHTQTYLHMYVYREYTYTLCTSTYRIVWDTHMQCVGYKRPTTYLQRTLMAYYVQGKLGSSEGHIHSSAV